MDLTLLSLSIKVFEFEFSPAYSHVRCKVDELGWDLISLCACARV